MSPHEKQAGQAEPPLEAPAVAEALDGAQFKQFLDRLPVAIAVSHLRPVERIGYANPEFERLTGVPEVLLKGRGWNAVAGSVATEANPQEFAAAIVSRDDLIGAYSVGSRNAPTSVDVWSSVIKDSAGAPVYRLVALTIAPPDEIRDELARKLHEKDVLLRELQHRVSNSLQMITALIRMEARSAGGDDKKIQFDRLAGRVNSLAVLYRSLSDAPTSDRVDLGAYLSEVASAVMHAHAIDGIRLDMRVDSWPVSVNVAMLTGLVINEILTNSLKHAFAGRQCGTISLSSLVDDTGCRVVIADDGIGLVAPAYWPKEGKLGALIVQSLEKNAKARVDVEPRAGHGLRVTISFERGNATPHD